MAQIMFKVSAGTEESSDAVVTVEPADELTVTVRSTLYAQFSEAIEKTVSQVLSEQQIKCGSITVADKGALDWIIRARTEAAIARGRGESI